MANQLKPGTFSDTIDTMAKAMEDAFLDQWSLFNPNLPVPGAESAQLKSMRLFFVAVSQGVVQHLRDNPAAFQVTVQNGSHSHSGGAHVHGDGSHTHSDGAHSQGGNVDQINTTGTTQ
jgi:hypothetical protein